VQRWFGWLVRILVTVGLAVSLVAGVDPAPLPALARAAPPAPQAAMPTHTATPSVRRPAALASGTPTASQPRPWATPAPPRVARAGPPRPAGPLTWNAVGAMTTAREGQTSTLLTDGQVLVAGGTGTGGAVLASAELYDPDTGTWTATGSLNVARANATATLLQNGEVLVAGGNGTGGTVLASAELYNPTTGSWTSTGAMATARYRHTATLLPSGQVLVAGGEDSSGNSLSSSELYNPTAGTWAATTGNLNVSRYGHTATLLPATGQVLVAGGFGAAGGAITFLNSTELFDPTSGTWTTAGNLANARAGQVATLLQNGLVLVAGGVGGAGTLATAETYSPANGWVATGSLATARSQPAAVLLPSGRLLVIGGSDSSGQALASVEEYDPTTGTWSGVAGLATATSDATATLLASGSVLVAGGATSATGGTPLAGAETFNPDVGTFTASGNLVAARAQPTALLLGTGSVLLTGGVSAGTVLTDTELYSPAQDLWSDTAGMNVPRLAASATLLTSGSVLVAGGAASVNPSVPVNSTETYNPSSGFWNVSASMSTARYGHTATLLPQATAAYRYGGKVLVAGGFGTAGTALTSAELYDLLSGTWSPTGSLNVARGDATATLLPNGQVLVVGGQDGSGNPLASAELYNLATGTWTLTGSLNTARYNHTATLLPDGEVLVVGGTGAAATSLSSAEIYDPATGTWSGTGSLNTARANATATLLPNGQVLVAGGASSNPQLPLGSAEIYDPVTGVWTATASLANARSQAAAVLLPDGQVLLAGGQGSTGAALNTSELYDVNPQADLGAAPAVTSPSPLYLELTTTLNFGSISGTGFQGVSEGSGGNANQSSATNYPLIQLRSLSNDQVLFAPLTGWTSSVLTTTIVADFPAGYALATVFANGIPSLSTFVTVFQAPSTVTAIEVAPEPDVLGQPITTTVTVTGNGGVVPTGLDTVDDGSGQTCTASVPGGSCQLTPTVTGTLPLTVTYLGDVNYSSSTDATAIQVLAPTGTSAAQWIISGGLAQPRQGNTITLLPDGQALVAGGYDSGFNVLASAELYDPDTGAWSQTGAMSSPRAGDTATLLPNGEVLVAGGNSSFSNVYPTLATAELYNPTSGAWTLTGSMSAARENATATLLNNGEVLVAGGCCSDPNSDAWQTAELYNPATGTWSSAGSMSSPRDDASATLLPSGKVLVAGGYTGGAAGVSLSSADLYDPATNTWSPAAAMPAALWGQSATLLADGTVLVAGGYAGGQTTAATIYDPTLNTWTATGSMVTARAFQSAVLLPSGNLLMVGGNQIAISAAKLRSGAAKPAGPSRPPTRPKALAFAGTSLTPTTEEYNPSTKQWTVAAGLNIPRNGSAATLLADGRVLVAGGVDANGNTIGAAEVYDPAVGSWSAAASLTTASEGQSATLLPNGQLLVAGGYAAGGTGATPVQRLQAVLRRSPGRTAVSMATSGLSALASAQLYNPSTGTWSATGSMSTGRFGQIGTLLFTGKVLVAGGCCDAQGNSLASSEVYDPSTGQWTGATDMVAPRIYHTATLLTDGDVLVTGGCCNATTQQPWSTAELYDPRYNQWFATGSMATARYGQTATLLPSGQVLVVGGIDAGGNLLASAELYDPTTGSWTSTGSLSQARAFHTATLLATGEVLVVGGEDVNGSPLSAAEVYDPSTGLWTTTGGLSIPRLSQTATLLADGQVLVTGGVGSNGTVALSERYDPTTGIWFTTGNLNTARDDQTTTLLPDGQVLTVGGDNGTGTTLSSAETYDLGLGFSAAWRPTVTTVTSPLNLGSGVTTTGARFTGVSEASGGNGSLSAPTNGPLLRIQSLGNGQSIWTTPTGWSTTALTTAAVEGLPDGYALATLVVNGIPSVGAVILVTGVNAPPPPTATATPTGSVTPTATPTGGSRRVYLPLVANGATGISAPQRR
jgi:N-acetylneuraminic acid mutarotase